MPITLSEAGGENKTTEWEGEGGVGIGETKMGMVGQILVAQVGAEDGDWRKLPGALITIALSSQGELTRSDTMCNTQKMDKLVLRANMQPTWYVNCDACDLCKLIFVQEHRSLILSKFCVLADVSPGNMHQFVALPD